MTIQEKQDEIIEEFSIYEDWMDKYSYLIELGKELKPLNPSQHSKENLIEGCVSRVWLDAEMKEGKIFFSADSDAIITKGIIALLIKVVSGHTPAEIKDADLYFIDKIGLRENLSPTRANGLLAMIKRIRLYALAYDAKSKQRG
ncbi:MAG: SufE family protein [Chlorobi bacterium]|nr:SufE family protein [Chlorobiota bacterium]